jgi:hypothetical protein
MKFAKYLPVEGEIKEGDYWQHPKGPIFPWTKAYERGPISSGLGKKVKLFLCSRDIKVGDTFKIDYPSIDSHLEDRVCTEVYNPNKVMNTGEKLPLMYMINATGAHLNHGECFKVIGEILTPNIKEGQKFTEKQIDYLTIGK